MDPARLTKGASVAPRSLFGVITEQTRSLGGGNGVGNGLNGEYKCLHVASHFLPSLFPDVVNDKISPMIDVKMLWLLINQLGIVGCVRFLESFYISCLVQANVKVNVQISNKVEIEYEDAALPLSPSTLSDRVGVFMVTARNDDRISSDVNIGL